MKQASVAQLVRRSDFTLELQGLVPEPLEIFVCAFTQVWVVSNRDYLLVLHNLITKSI